IVNFIPGRSGPTDPDDGLADGHEVAAVLAGDALLRLGGVLPGLAYPRPQPLDLVGGVLERGLELEDALDAGEPDALVGELLDVLEQLDVAVGVPAAPAPGALRLDENLSPVDPQRLRVHAGELRRHRDDVERSFVVVHRHTPKCSRGFSVSALPRSSIAFLAAPSTFLGTTTSNVTSRSPGLPLPVSIPRPRTFTVLPLCVPGGTFTVTGLSRVGTFTCVPSAASVNVIGTRTVRSVPLRPKIGCFPTCTTTNRSPGE